MASEEQKRGKVKRKDRDARRAAALRENLKRRKNQFRARRSEENLPPDEPGGD